MRENTAFPKVEIACRTILVESLEATVQYALNQFLKSVKKQVPGRLVALDNASQPEMYNFDKKCAYSLRFLFQLACVRAINIP